MITRLSSVSSIKLLLFACFCVAAAIGLGVEHRTIDRLEADNATMALQHVNDSAAAAKTVVVSATNAQLAKVLGDSLRMFERPVVQVAQHADAVDRALGRTRLALDSATLRLDSLQRLIASRSAVTEDSSHVRRASFDVRQAPYTVTAAVELPPAPDTAHLDLRIALDPIPVVARLSCAPPDSHGIRAAAIDASAPAWAAIRFDNVQQSPDLCASPALTHASGHRFIQFKWLVVGAGRIVEPDGTSRWGGFAGPAFAFGS